MATNDGGVVVRGPGFTFGFNLDEFTGELDDVSRKQLPYALMMTLNRTTEEAQAAVQNRIRRRGFIIRSAASDAWLTKQVKFMRGDRAQKDRLEASLSITPFSAEGGTRSKSLLSALEEGTERVGTRPIGPGAVFGNALAIPARSSPMEQIPRALYPKNLGLQARRKIEGGLTATPSFRGKRRTFTVRTSAGQGIVLQRFGKGKRDTRPLFWIKQRTRVPGRFFFVSTVRQTVEDRLAPNFVGFFKLAMETRK